MVAKSGRSRTQKLQKGGSRGEAKQASVTRKHANMSRKQVLSRTNERRKAKLTVKMAKDIIKQRAAKQAVLKAVHRKTHRVLASDMQVAVLDGLSEAIRNLGDTAVTPVSVFAAATTAILKESSEGLSALKPRLPYLLTAIAASKSGLSTNFVVQKLDIVRQVSHRVLTTFAATDVTSCAKATKLLVDFALRSVTGPIMDTLRAASIAERNGDMATVASLTKKIVPQIPVLSERAFKALLSCEPSKFASETPTMFASGLRRFFLHLFSLDERQKIAFGVTTGADDEWEDVDSDDEADGSKAAADRWTAPQGIANETLWTLRFALLKLLPVATTSLLRGISEATHTITAAVCKNVSEIVRIMVGRCVAEFAGYVLRDDGQIEDEQSAMITNVFDPVVLQLVEFFKTSAGARARWPDVLKLIAEVYGASKLTILKRSSHAASYFALRTALPLPTMLPQMKCDAPVFEEQIQRDDAAAAGRQKRLPSIFEVSPSSKLLLRVLDKLRCMDDSSINSAIDDAMVAICNCSSFAEVLEILPFNPHEVEDDSQQVWTRSYLANSVWRKCAHHDSLKVFVSTLLPRIQDCDQKIHSYTASGRYASAQQFGALRDQYWRICATLCDHPTDFDEVSFRTLAKAIVGLLDDANNKGSAAAHAGCAALSALCASFSKLAAEDDEEDDDDEASDTGDARLGDELLNRDDEVLHPHQYHFIPRSHAIRVCNIISKYSKNIMPKLCNAAEGVSNAPGSSVLTAVANFAKVCQPAVMEAVLKSICDVGANVVAGVHLEEGGLSVQRRMVLDIAIGVVPQLDATFLRRLVDEIVSPALMCVSRAAADDDVATNVVNAATIALQKKGYKLLHTILNQRLRDISDLMPQIVQLLRDSASTAQPAAMKIRIGCLLWALDACKIFEPEQTLTFGLEFLDEIMLSTRERSSQSRILAMQWVERFYRYAESCTSPDGRRGSIAVVHRVLAGLAGKTPLSLSATILVLAKLLWCGYENPPLSRSEYTRLFLMVFGLIDHAAAEIRNASVIFARTALKLSARAPVILKALSASATGAECVEAAVDSPVAALVRAVAVTVSQTHVASATRTQMQQLIERALEHYPSQILERLFPSGSRKFLLHVVKQRRRSDRLREREQDKGEQAKLVAMLNKQGALLPTNTEDDSELNLMDEAGIAMIASRSAPKNQPKGESDDELGDDGYHLDVLENGKIRIVTTAQKSAEVSEHNRKSTAEKLLRQAENMNRGVRKASVQGPTIAAGEVNDTGKRRRTAEVEDFENEELFRVHGNLAAEGDRAARPSGATQRERELKNTTKDSKRHRIERDIKKGDEFASQTGLGDVKKGKVEPFAYVPLSRAMLNKRNQNHRVARFKAVDHKGLRGAKALRLSKAAVAE